MYRILRVNDTTLSSDALRFEFSCCHFNVGFIEPQIDILVNQLFQIHTCSIHFCSGLCSSSPIVSKVSPRDIGRGGGVITIEGAGFSEDVFNQFDPVLGNKVLVYSF